VTSAQDIIAKLRLKLHPEGGHYRETFRDPALTDNRAASTAIYYLLQKGERSHWHKIDASEAWHWYAGAPLELLIAAAGAEPAAHILGGNLLQDQAPQIIVPAQTWQSARCLGEWTLAGCTVAPGFEFSGFELAPPDFSP
jgi:predicted cupin superfamily sugar epimerase